MAITVKFFASLREQLEKHQVNIDAREPLTTEQVWAHASDNQPLPNPILIAVNLAYVDAKTLVSDGDEVAFFPPVTGG